VQHCPAEQAVQSSPYSYMRPYGFRTAAVQCSRAAHVDLQSAGSATASISVQLGHTRTVHTDHMIQPAEEEGHDFQIWNFFRFVVRCDFYSEPFSLLRELL
jgi:hypothetical protein